MFYIMGSYEEVSVFKKFFSQNQCGMQAFKKNRGIDAFQVFDQLIAAS